MTPETPVWVSTARTGIAYHEIRWSGRSTLCGRYIGAARVGNDFDGVERGHVLPLASVVDQFGSKPCRACNGSSVPPIVVPRGAPGRSHG